MDSLVITLREGVEAALVVGIILTYLRKTGRLALQSQVYWGLGLAILASLGVAVLFKLVGFDPENEYLEGAFLGTAALFVASMVVWMWRAARRIKGDVERRLDTLVSSPGKGLGLGVGLFTFFMVFREGVETVFFLMAATWGAITWQDFLGGVMGLGLAVLFGLFFIRGTLRIDLRRFFLVTGVVLLLLTARLLAGSLHEFAEVGVIPMSAGVMKGIGYFVRDRNSDLLLLVLLALPLLLILWGSRRPEIPSPEPASRAHLRKLQAQVRGERLWRGALLLATLAVFIAMGSTALAGSNLVDPAPQPVKATGEEILIPISTLKERKLYKFSYESSGQTIRFLAYRSAEGTLATALDRCQLCGDKGYLQEEPNAICKNCNAPIPFTTLGLGGGCNPLRLASSLKGDNLAINVADLAAP